jgi:hypothetical protein
MNWKRGLLRLWLILSLLWLVGAGSIAVLESSPVQQRSIPLTDDERAPRPGFVGSERDSLVECSGSNSNNAEAFLDCFDADSSEPRLTDGREPRFGQFGTRFDTTGLTPVGTTRVEYVRDWNLPERDVMSLIIGVPLLALGLGMALTWIASGFRDPN